MPISPFTFSFIVIDEMQLKYFTAPSPPVPLYKLANVSTQTIDVDANKSELLATDIEGEGNKTRDSVVRGRLVRRRFFESETTILP